MSAKLSRSHKAVERSPPDLSTPTFQISATNAAEVSAAKTLCWRLRAMSANLLLELPWPHLIRSAVPMAHISSSMILSSFSSTRIPSGSSEYIPAEDYEATYNISVR